MHNKTVAELAKALAAGEFSSVELTRHFLQRINGIGAELNTMVTVCDELALAQAQQADKQRQNGDAHALTGIPIVHKDIFCTDGVKTSCGSRMLDNFIAPYDAHIVSQCKNAGMVMLGKSNMDEFAMGSSNETSYYGAVKNPWHLECVPGGSSGGSAAVVAARLAPLATGTDTGGSIRQPAALCGISGLKPTYGRVSRYGMIAFASSLDQAGPMTRTAEDAALLMNIMAGHDGRDSTCLDKAVPDYTQGLNDDIKGLKVGLPKEYFDAQLDPAIGAIMQQAVDELKKAGVEFVDISLPNTELAVSAYYVVAPAEASSNLSRFDGVRYGYRCRDPKDLEDLYKRSRAEGFGAEVKRRIMIGTYALSAGYYDADYLKAQKVRQLISEDFRQAFQKVDVILGPTSPCVAFKIGEKSDDPIAMYLSDAYTIAVNLAGIPGMSIPAGMLNGLPVGMQLIGNYFAEGRLLNLAHRFQCITDWHQAVPAAYQ